MGQESLFSLDALKSQSRKDACIVSIKLTSLLCADEVPFVLDEGYTSVSLPTKVVEEIMSKVGENADTETVFRELKNHPKVNEVVEKACKSIIGSHDEILEECKSNMIRRIAESILEEF